MDLEVRVPATIANLGPGFDRLGVALDIHLQVSFSSTDRTEVLRGGTPVEAADDLIHRGFEAAFRTRGAAVPAVRIVTTQSFPAGRGLGASAAAIVAGLIAADSVGELGLGQPEIADLGIDIEGHADNVLPALLGGLILHSGSGWLRMTPADSISALVLVSPGEMPTDEARKVLPPEVPRADAVSNAAACAALVLALRGIEGPEVLSWALQDKVHVPYRLQVMPETATVLERLAEAGFAATLSGAGPSLVCLVPTAELEGSRASVQGMLEPGWSVLTPTWDLKGAQTR